MPMRVAIVDDDQLFATSLKVKLEGFSEVESITLAVSGEDFVHGLKKSGAVHPQVVLMDISMRYSTEGIHATKLVHELYPEIRVVMLTSIEEHDRIFEAFKAGAVGYLLKNEEPGFIVKAILEVAQGGALMSPSIAMKTIRFLTGKFPVELKAVSISFQLSDREIEVLHLIAKGFSYKMIASQLFISIETVKKHMSNIFKKLQVKNKVEAINKTKEMF